MPVERISSFRGLGVGSIEGHRLKKKIGDIVTATITFEHSGKGGSFDVGFGLAPTATFGHRPITHWFFKRADYADSAIWASRTITITATIPTNMEVGVKDALAWIQTAGGERDPGGDNFLQADHWHDAALDIVSADVVIAQFRNLTASYA